MTTRFADLKKIPREPAARLLAKANARLQTRLRAPAAAPIETVLAELEAASAWVDIIRLLSAALPPRERVWWACLAARDLIGAEAKPTPTLAAAEAWVFKPTEENRVALRAALDGADVYDDCTLCATAALFADGTLGPGEHAHHPAPPGAAEAAAFGMNLLALGHAKGPFPAEANALIDRALDIARGGNGRRVAEAAGAAPR